MNVSFEENESDIQNLTFEGFHSQLIAVKGKRHNIDVELKNGNGVYTNFSLMLSDQCPWHIEFITENIATELQGSIFSQLFEAISIMDEINPQIKIGGRSGYYKRYPSIAFKEAMYNATIHFDASLMKNIEVNIAKDMVTVSSPGEIYLPKVWKDVSCTNPRNWNMAKILEGMECVSMKGRGLDKVKQCYKGSRLIPTIISSDGMFSINMPALDNPLREDSESEKAILQYLSMKHGATVQEISTDLFLSKDHVKKMIAKMEKDNELFCIGIGSKKTVYLCNTAIKTQLKRWQ